MKKTKKTGMLWYHYLVQFLLPLSIFFNLLLIVVAARMFSPIAIALISSRYGFSLEGLPQIILVTYIFWCMLIIPFFKKIGIRKSLRKLDPDALERLNSWYRMPAILWGILFFLLIPVGLKKYLPPLIIVAVLILRAVVMIRINEGYFEKHIERIEINIRRPKKLKKTQKKKSKKNKGNSQVHPNRSGLKTLKAAAKRVFLLGEDESDSYSSDEDLV